MRTLRPVVALLALATLPVVAPAADDVAALRAEMQALKSEYSARVDALEARIEQLETANAAAADAASAMASAPPPPEPEPAPPPTPAGSAANAFNPAISLILGGTYTSTSRDPADWRIAGFAPAGDENGPGDRSFNLGESELTFAASIDPYFAGTLTAAINADNEIEVEEAFFRTTALRDGFSVKGGRFFSGFGYLNEVHAHAWDFVDQPLVYQAMFGGQYKQNGVQVKWLAPTDLFLEIGAETGNGDNFPGTRLADNGFNGATLFAHVGGDLGDDTSWRAGASWLTSSAEHRSGGIGDADGVPLFDAFSGDSDTWVVDGVLKWAPSPRRQLKVQGEYLHRRESGSLFDASGGLLADDYRNMQSGWYLQGVYQFAPRWRVGARYDSLDGGTPTYAFAPPNLPDASPQRISLMLDWNPSEFSRLRAQYDWDDARDDGDTDRALRLQYIYGIGAHGAHKY
ncbi:MAG TPA: hypothetical protein VFL16_02385 [Steroidobacteraceae bacterium]|nr:hypothetical protein [Steroidobacteraceae bacterium]